jgi:hypothetical protein
MPKEIVLPTVQTVEAKRIGEHYWQYIAYMHDGTSEMIRKKATRLYDCAFYYNRRVCGGNKTGLTRYFSFGKNPSSHYRDYHTATFFIIKPSAFPAHCREGVREESER